MPKETIPVDAEVKWVDIKKIKPNPKNRNVHSAEQIERLSKLLKHYGWRKPLIISKQSGLLVSGHARLLASKLLKVEKVPVVYQDFEDEDEEMAFGIADNAIAAWGELDLSGINVDIGNLDGINFDIDLLGIKDFTVDINEDAKEHGESEECPSCGRKVKLKDGTSTVKKDGKARNRTKRRAGSKASPHSMHK